MAAKVIALHQGVSWETVREKHDRAQQMGSQTLAIFIEIGHDLMALKDDKIQTPHGTFLEKAQRIALLKKREVQHYMQVASHEDEVKNATSLNAALNLLRKPKAPKQFRVGWADYLVQELGGKDARVYHAIHRGSRGAEVEALPGFQSHFTDREQAREFCDAWVRHFTPEIEAPKLEPKGEQKVRRAIYAETAKIHRELHEFVDRKVHEETIAQRIEMQKKTEEAERRVQSYEIAISKINVFMTVDEYRLILGCLHPDRAPAHLVDRFQQAFVIMKRLDKYFE